LPRRPVLPEELPEEPEAPEVITVNTVTVLVAPAQVQELILAQEIGQDWEAFQRSLAKKTQSQPRSPSSRRSPAKNPG